MAKRRRASLKDKSPETLGMTQKQGKGIDLLFGGSADDAESGDIDQSELIMSQDRSLEDDASETDTFDDDLSGIATPDEGLVDELGLPVALEEPPDDLILASATAASTEEQVDPVDPVTSPFALPETNGSNTDTTDDANDLSGIFEQENLPVVEEDTLPSLENENDLSGIVDEQASAEDTLSASPPDDDLSGLSAAGEDLSGLVVDDNQTGFVEDGSMAAGDLSGLGANDFSGLAAEEAIPAQDAVNDLSGLITEEDDFSGIDTPPPTTAAPINVPPPAGAFASQPTFGSTVTPAGSVPGYSNPPAGYASSPPSPSSNIPPPSTATGAPNLSPQRSRDIEFDELSEGGKEALSLLGNVLTKDDLDPRKDDFGGDITLADKIAAERDDAITEQVLRYVGPERRDALFDEIQALHERVAAELSGNSKDVNFALDILRDANNYIIENPREYDEAVYRVTIVKAMLARRQRLSRYSYRLGIWILLYGIVFTIACIWGFFAPINFGALLRGEELGSVFEAIWFSGLAGGLGGSVLVMWRLYYRVSEKQDFDPQYLMYYLVKPILGFSLGLMMYFTIGVIVAFGGSTLPIAGTNTGFILTILLGFIAGFREEVVFKLIYEVTKKIAPQTESGGKKSVIPVDDATMDQIQSNPSL